MLFHLSEFFGNFQSAQNGVLCRASVSNPTPKSNAGSLSTWLAETYLVLSEKKREAKVPCFECNACCRSSMFIHIAPEEVQTLNRIPKSIQFKAPGLPRGYVVVGFNQKGECPMLIENKCSIYQFRPQTCRDFDCRIFSAAKKSPDIEAQALLKERVAQWVFEYNSTSDEDYQNALLSAVDFLEKNRFRFPAIYQPKNQTQLIIFSIKVHKIFLRQPGVDEDDVSEFVRKCMREFESFSQQMTDR